MKREGYDTYRIINKSTRKANLSVFMDSFPIEKVRFEIVNYETKERNHCYLDFSTVFLIADKISTGVLFKNKNQVEVYYGGKQSSEAYGGKPESRTMTVNLSQDEKGNYWVFVKMTEGEGTLNETGGITPLRDKIRKDLTVRVSYDDLREIFLTASEYAKASLPRLVMNLLNELK